MQSPLVIINTLKCHTNHFASFHDYWTSTVPSDNLCIYNYRQQLGLTRRVVPEFTANDKASCNMDIITCIWVTKALSTHYFLFIQIYIYIVPSGKPTTDTASPRGGMSPKESGDMSFQNSLLSTSNTAKSHSWEIFLTLALYLIVEFRFATLINVKSFISLATCALVRIFFPDMTNPAKWQEKKTYGQHNKQNGFHSFIHCETTILLLWYI